MSHAQWGVVVRSLESGELLYERNGSRLMMPASNMKILTVAGAAHALGWDKRFATTLETSALIEGGVLKGDLIVRGSGDPTINTRNDRGAAVFADFAAALKAAGITQVSGRLIGDDQAFDDEGIGGGWAWDYLQYGYAAPVGALQYNENVAQLSVQPGAAAGDPAIVKLAPGSGLTVLNRAVTVASGTPESIDFRRHLDRPVLEVTGRVPLPDPPAPGAPAAPVRTVTRLVAVVNPTVFFVQSLKDALAANGITIFGGAVDLDHVVETTPLNGGERRVLATSESPTVAEIATVLMKVSQNLYAESLLKAIGAASDGVGTTAAGRTAVVGALEAWKIDSRSLVMADGSGLSRYNYVTADLMARVLERMYTDENHRERFMATMPIAGKDGTVATRMRRSRAEGNAAAKTGSISNVRSLSGYVRSRDGEMLVFSILANDFVVPAATVNWITDLAIEVLADFSRQ